MVRILTNNLGGSAVIIKHSIYHFDKCHLHTEIPLTVVAIKSTKQMLKVGAVYFPPKYNLKVEDYLVL